MSNLYLSHKEQHDFFERVDRGYLEWLYEEAKYRKQMLQEATKNARKRKKEENK
jgi:hypothetical protein